MQNYQKSTWSTMTSLDDGMVRLSNIAGPLCTPQEISQNPAFHDVRITCDNDRVVSSSKLLLAAVSPMMLSLLLDSDDDDTIQMRLIGYEADDVIGLIKLISTGEYEAPSEAVYQRIKTLMSNMQMRCVGDNFEMKAPLKADPDSDVDITADPALYPADLVEALPPKLEDVADFDLDNCMAELEKAEKMLTVQQKKKRKKRAAVSTIISDQPRPEKQLKTVRGKWNYQCVKCPKVVRGRWLLMNHMQGHLGDIAQQCRVCQQTINNTRELQQHRTEHGCEVETYEVQRSGLKPGKANAQYKYFDCLHCQSRIRGEWPFIIHMTTHIGDKARECKECGKIIQSDKQWYSHKNVHVDSAEVCDICGKVLKSRWSLFQHKENIHDRKGPQYECHICLKKLTTKNSLFNHVNEVHGTSRDFICDICGHASKSKVGLSTHKKQVHTQDKPYKCDLCEKSFIGKFKLMEHRAMHDGEKSVPCRQCGKTFHTERRMLNHMEGVHRGYRFACGICNGSFKQLPDLHRHLVTHTNLKPYCCAECKQGFNHGETARRHFRANHPDKKVKITFVNSDAFEDLKSKAVKKIEV